MLAIRKLLNWLFKKNLENKYLFEGTFLDKEKGQKFFCKDRKKCFLFKKKKFMLNESLLWGVVNKFLKQLL